MFLFVNKNNKIKNEVLTILSIITQFKFLYIFEEEYINVYSNHD